MRLSVAAELTDGKGGGWYTHPPDRLHVRRLVRSQRALADRVCPHAYVSLRVPADYKLVVRIICRRDYADLDLLPS